MPQNTWMPAVVEMEAGRRWHFLNAEGQVLGRLATQAAGLLAGKGKPQITPHLDCGDFVVITNAARVRVTGNKQEQKFYFRHSGYASGKKVIPYRLQMSKDPTRVVYLAVRRMLDSNRLRDKRLKRLKIFPSAQHPFKAPPEPA